jgi:chaperone modulatory protein CbpM
MRPWPRPYPSILAHNLELKAMTTSGNQPLSGAIFEESNLLTVEELSRICAVDERHIVELVDEGVISVVEVGTVQWRFSGTALRRTRLALRLERDLELNLAGVALALDLMEEVERLRRELRARS